MRIWLAPVIALCIMLPGCAETVQDTVRITRIIDRTVFVSPPPPVGGGDGEGGADEGQVPGGKAENISIGLGGNKNPGALNGKKVKMRVVLKKHTLISTDPQNGRLVQSISN